MYSDNIDVQYSE